MNSISIRPLIKTDWTSISKIYADGIATGIATFETEIPNWEAWNEKYIESCRIVAVKKEMVVGFAVLSKVSSRQVYKGVAEVTVYVSKDYRGQYVGETLLKQLIKESETHGFWTLQAGIFSKNVASIEMHKKFDFRVIGIRKQIGQLNGKWHDNHFLERRSKLIGV